MFFIVFYPFFQFCLLTVESVSKSVRTSNISFETFVAFQKIIHVVGNDMTIQIKMETIVANN